MEIKVQSSKQNLGIEAAPHLHAPLTTNRIMLWVLIALTPGFLAAIYFFGTAVVWQFLIAAFFCHLSQLICAKLRGKNLKRSFADLSSTVTAALLALTLPSLLPWYLTAAAALFAIIVVKECFGGLGMNIFNPAMSGFIFLVISVPGIFYSTYLAPAPGAYAVADFNSTFKVIFEGADPAALYADIKALVPQMDGLTGATFLESIKTLRKAGGADSVVAIDFATDGFLAYAVLGICYAAGGCLLAVLGIISLKMPLVFILTILGAGALYHHLDPAMSISATEHLLMGGTMLAAFFIITDPVTNSGTGKGRMVFAFLTAFLVIIIRVNGSYSDSVAFAVMLGNATAPLIDVLTRRRPFGIGYRAGGLK